MSPVCFRPMCTHPSARVVTTFLFFFHFFFLNWLSLLLFSVLPCLAALAGISHTMSSVGPDSQQLSEMLAAAVQVTDAQADNQRTLSGYRRQILQLERFLKTLRGDSSLVILDREKDLLIGMPSLEEFKKFIESKRKERPAMHPESLTQFRSALRKFALYKSAEDVSFFTDNELVLLKRYFDGVKNTCSVETRQGSRRSEEGDVLHSYN